MVRRANGYLEKTVSANQLLFQDRLLLHERNQLRVAPDFCLLLIS